jgi:hypothetical protein
MLPDSRFEHRMGSDIQRNGMFLELVEVGSGEAVAEVFYSDQSGTFSISLDRSDLPLEAVEHLISAARTRLVPTRGR